MFSLCFSFSLKSDISLNNKQIKGIQRNDDMLSEETQILYQLDELQRCDILIRPNHNWFPGTTDVEGGFGFGHCVIVIEGTKGNNTDSVLMNSTIFESQARNVPGIYQLRSVKAFVPGDDMRFANTSFSPEYKGLRYRLRMSLTESQKDSIISFIFEQDDDLSSWRAVKNFDRCKKNNPNSEPLDKKYWYCSLLIWQAFYHVLGIDLDENSGLTVFPNDIINSHYFNDDNSLKQKRVRF